MQKICFNIFLKYNIDLDFFLNVNLVKLIMFLKFIFFRIENKKNRKCILKK